VAVEFDLEMGTGLYRAVPKLVSCETRRESTVMTHHFRYINSGAEKRPRRVSETECGRFSRPVRHQTKGPVEKHQSSHVASFTKPENNANRQRANWNFSTGPTEFGTGNIRAADTATINCTLDLDP
jgi:hypothetical protein